MKSYSRAKIRITDKSLLVHFEKVGSRAKFNLIRNNWLTQFPQSYWNKQYRAWELPPANLEDVINYCRKMFWQVNIEKQPAREKQLSLFK